MLKHAGLDVTSSGALSSAAVLPLWQMLLFTFAGWELEWNSPGMDISSDRKDPRCWHKKHDSGGWKSEEEGVSPNARRVLKRVEHFSTPATFQSIKIDLFVMKGDPFRILRACNLCEMGVSLTKTGRQRLKNDRGKEESGSGRDWGQKENRPIVLIWSLFWLSEMNFCRLLPLQSLIPWTGSSTLGQPRQIKKQPSRVTCCTCVLKQADGGKAA